jgi:hypothetical protein
MKLYLAHPFDARNWVRSWELEVEKRLKIEFLNPFYGVPDRTDIEKIDAGRQERYAQIDPTELVNRDLQHMRKCVGLVGIVDGSLSYGTIMEIVYAKSYQLPVFLIVTNGHHEHPWLVYHSTKIFTSLVEFENYFKDSQNDSRNGIS